MTFGASIPQAHRASATARNQVRDLQFGKPWTLRGCDRRARHCPYLVARLRLDLGARRPKTVAHRLRYWLSFEARLELGSSQHLGEVVASWRGRFVSSGIVVPSCSAWSVDSPGCERSRRYMQPVRSPASR